MGGNRSEVSGSSVPGTLLCLSTLKTGSETRSVDMIGDDSGKKSRLSVIYLS